jgi:NADPH:quinone reductase-like Zn-dependent oxidoreductase
MTYGCVVRRLESGEVAIAAENAEAPPVQADAVLLEVERSVVDGRHVDQVLDSGTNEQSWMSLDWGSLVGRVIEAGSEVEGIRPGDRVSAIGPVASRVARPARECLVVPDDVDTSQAAYWALLVALVRSIKWLQIELGESVLVLGGGLVGSLAAQLSLVAGAAAVVGVDHRRVVNAEVPQACESGLPLTWVADPETLQGGLPRGEVDVLIDVLGDFGRLYRMLSLVRVGGRAMSLAANDATPVDFDFYPNIHRRSLRLSSSTLQAGLCHNSRGAESSTRETAFIEYLLQGNRLGLTDQIAAYVGLGDRAEQVLPISGDTSLMVQWSVAQ